jgi:hypothetical protein
MSPRERKSSYRRTRKKARRSDAGIERVIGITPGDGSGPRGRGPRGPGGAPSFPGVGGDIGGGDDDDDDDSSSGGGGGGGSTGGDSSGGSDGGSSGGSSGGGTDNDDGGGGLDLPPIDPPSGTILLRVGRSFGDRPDPNNIDVRFINESTGGTVNNPEPNRFGALRYDVSVGTGPWSYEVEAADGRLWSDSFRVGEDEVVRETVRLDVTEPTGGAAGFQTDLVNIVDCELLTPDISQGQDFEVSVTIQNGNDSAARMDVIPVVANTPREGEGIVVDANNTSSITITSNEPTPGTFDVEIELRNVTEL